MTTETTSAEGHYIVVYDAAKRATAYGPFRYAADAYLANLKRRPLADSPGGDWTKVRVYIQRGVGMYSTGELDGIASEPRCYDMTAFKVRPASAVRVHASWKVPHAAEVAADMIGRLTARFG